MRYESPKCTGSSARKSAAGRRDPHDPPSDSESAGRVDGVFDIETHEWDQFVACGLLDASGYREFWSENQAADALLASTGRIYAHNGGRFDALWLLRHIQRRKIPADILLAGQRVIRVKVGELEICDSAALVPLSLDAFARAFGRSKAPTNLPCDCDSPSHCGGYCSIRPDMPGHLKRRLSEYLRADCDVLLASIRDLFTYAAVNALQLRLTIGASAWQFAREYCDLPDTDWTPRDYSFARRGYYGGRTQVFRRESAAGYRYDINSAYPAALSKMPIPVGDRSWAVGHSASKAYASGREGIYAAVVEVPPCHIPPLPFRSRRGMRLTYPTGTLAGVWSGFELRAAQSAGARVQLIERGLVWSDSAVALGTAVDWIWHLRANALNKHLGTWLKLYGNSLTGKFAQAPEMRSVKMCSESELGDSVYCQGATDCGGGLFHDGKSCCPHYCHRLCGRWMPLDGARTIWARSYYRIAPCAHVQWSAYLTASARAELLAGLQDASDGAVYCDTDSVFRESPQVRNVGAELGQWKAEGPYADFSALAPKTYSYFDAESWEFIARSKGIPDAARSWGDIAAGRPVENNRGANSFLTASRRGDMFSRKSLARKVKMVISTVGDRAILPDRIRTRPHTVEEIEALKW